MLINILFVCGGLLIRLRRTGKCSKANLLISPTVIFIPLWWTIYSKGWIFCAIPYFKGISAYTVYFFCISLQAEKTVTTKSNNVGIINYFNKRSIRN